MLFGHASVAVWVFFAPVFSTDLSCRRLFQNVAAYWGNRPKTISVSRLWSQNGPV